LVVPNNERSLSKSYKLIQTAALASLWICKVSKYYIHVHFHGHALFYGVN